MNVDILQKTGVVYVVSSGADNESPIMQGARLTLASAMQYADDIRKFIERNSHVRLWRLRKDSTNYKAMWFDERNDRWVRIDVVNVSE